MKNGKSTLVEMATVFAEQVRERVLEDVAADMKMIAGESREYRASRGAAPVTRAPKPKSRKAGEKRSAIDFTVIMESVVAWLERDGGLRAEQLAEKSGFSTKELALPIKKLLARKLIKRAGQRRGTVYRLA